MNIGEHVDPGVDRPEVGGEIQGCGQKLPQFIEECEHRARTYKMLTQGENIENVNTRPIMISLVIVSQSPIIVVTITILTIAAGGKPVDASQEMVALGICNIFGSFVQAMPTTGSFSR